LTEIQLKKGEPVEKALRRLKKKIDREGTLKVVRNHRRFEKPSEPPAQRESGAVLGDAQRALRRPVKELEQWSTGAMAY